MLQSVREIDLVNKIEAVMQDTRIKIKKMSSSISHFDGSTGTIIDLWTSRNFDLRKALRIYGLIRVGMLVYFYSI
ncbi:hypothetical protein HYN46_09305 [Aquirhabdus parva]|uniref:Uncharacterized protein n=1 Tax=Aquirhabdus parva TaxID=2283318 RepID=A0A345P6W0_9GAMM|nr:hypothetical protein HYN46_09305 [Aquirhabdus parva]